MEIGLSTFAETFPLEDGTLLSHKQRLHHIIEEIKLADQVGLDVYGIGEHHRHEFAASAPEVILAAAATVTNNIKLSSATTILSTVDPVRVFQNYATLDALSEGRAEIMVGRGSFTESFPLFGHHFEDKGKLFTDRLDLLLNIRKNPKKVHWQGQTRPAINGLGVFPLPVQEKLPIWVGSIGTDESIITCAKLGLPISFAIIKGNPLDFKPKVELYKKEWAKAGHPKDELQIGCHVHGYVGCDDETAIEQFYHSTKAFHDVIGPERGRPPFTKEIYHDMISKSGPLFVGGAQTLISRITELNKVVGINRFMLHLPLGSMPHHLTMEAIERLGTVIKPAVNFNVE